MGHTFITKVTRGGEYGCLFPITDFSLQLNPSQSLALTVKLNT